mmetsp:Transcript_100219/g.238989  ORF Transcript_100219/g.238989 Transcript_100219/m.238989 type:complete len:126 (+) Transcript_100219:56-433(+)
MGSWKQNFKAHRIAANMGLLGENFIYHREMESFPTSMKKTLRVSKKGPSAMTRASRGLNSLYKTLLPGGKQGRLGIIFGLCLPLAGTMIVYSFVTTMSGNNTAELYELELQRQRAQDQARKAMDV